MGTTVSITIVDAPPTAIEMATSLVRDLHRRWTRFDLDSEIGRLNQANGALVVLEPDTFDVISAAISAFHNTNGSFDPTVATSMRAAGYDRDLEQLSNGVFGHEFEPAPGCSGIELLPDIYGVVMPPGVEIDLGGIGKGAAADLVAAAVMGLGAAGVCINLGGDVTVKGISPTSDPWTIELVPTAQAGRDPLVVRLNDGAVCTSRTDLRKWDSPTGPRHHIVDPTSGAPVPTTIVSVSVLATNAISAEPLTKAALVAGPRHARSVLSAAGVPAVIGTFDGSLHAVGNIREYLR
ncbi:MAG: FAD:protein FMN transferase [Actinobacteria bacterium]|nr:FAD:protein FMN transferase [Actinomycetota bacterium]